MRKPHHSPLPWKRGTDGFIFDANGEYILDTYGSPALEADENQRYIVRAVNSHAELLAACKNAVASLSITQLPRLDNSVATDAEIIAVAIKSLQATIKKAESGDTEES